MALGVTTVAHRSTGHNGVVRSGTERRSRQGRMVEAAVGEGSKEEELGCGVEGMLGEGVAVGKGQTLCTGQPGTTSPEQRREGASEDRTKAGSSSKEGSRCCRK